MKKNVFLVLVLLFIFGTGEYILYAQSLSEWSKLSLGMRQSEVLSLVGKPVGTITISNITGMPKSVLTKKVKDSLEFTLWSYNEAKSPIETSGGELKGKTLRFDDHGILTEIGNELK